MSGDPPTPPDRPLAEVLTFPCVSGGGDRGPAAPVIGLEAYRDSRAHRARSPRDGLADEHGRAGSASVIDLATYRAARGTPGLDPAA
jgi:hypothetical protein